jgi:hypothetical protein
MVKPTTAAVINSGTLLNGRTFTPQKNKKARATQGCSGLEIYDLRVSPRLHLDHRHCRDGHGDLPWATRECAAEAGIDAAAHDDRAIHHRLCE